MHFCGHGDLLADRLCGIRDHMSAVHSVGCIMPKVVRTNGVFIFWLAGIVRPRPILTFKGRA